MVMPDNGKAFKNKVFVKTDIDLTTSGMAGLYGRLGILCHFPKAYSARSKPIESFFKTMGLSFEKAVSSYCGGSIAAKPARMMRNEKFMQEIEPETVITMEEASGLFESWLNTFYRVKPHSGLGGKCPGEVFAAGRGPGLDHAAIRCLMMHEEVATIHNNGIKLFGGEYFDEALYGLRDKVFVRFDWHDLRQIWVYRKDGAPLCMAKRQGLVHPMFKLVGGQDAEAIQRFQGRHRRTQTPQGRHQKDRAQAVPGRTHCRGARHPARGRAGRHRQPAPCREPGGHRSAAHARRPGHPRFFRARRAGPCPALARSSTPPIWNFSRPRNSARSWPISKLAQNREICGEKAIRRDAKRPTLSGSRQPDAGQPSGHRQVHAGPRGGGPGQDGNQPVVEESPIRPSRPLSASRRQWACSWLLGEIVVELGLVPEKRTSDLFHQAVGELMGTDRTLIFDEIDYVAEKRTLVETIRDIGDMAGTPIILIGMPWAPEKLKRFPALWRRISQVVPYHGLTAADVRLVMDQICEVAVDDSAVAAIAGSAKTVIGGQPLPLGASLRVRGPGQEGGGGHGRTPQGQGGLTMAAARTILATVRAVLATRTIVTGRFVAPAA